LVKSIGKWLKNQKFHTVRHSLFTESVKLEMYLSEKTTVFITQKTVNETKLVTKCSILMYKKCDHTKISVSDYSC